MTIELAPTTSPWFEKIYEGYNPRTGVRVVAIMDNNCVRYHVYHYDKHVGRHGFSNDKKDKCFRNATRRLNK